MDIKQAKEEIRRTVLAYTERDALGALRIPMVRQRPLLLMGPPGVGKTAIFYQLAQELGVNLVSYTMTHHTRQSALGLPVLREKTFGGKTYTATEYTMSEILASVYERIEKTGVPTGILFLDEINCVSETLMPAMLQLLQSKQFGTHRLPEGWVIAAAGNPPAYNESARTFDTVTMDRVRLLQIEADYHVWRDYAHEKGLHPAVLSYLELNPEHFFCVERHAHGRSFVTARGWEDLSQLLTSYERLGFEIQDALFGEFLQHEEIAASFAAFFRLFAACRDRLDLAKILSGQETASAPELRAMGFDARLAATEFLLHAVSRELNTFRQKKALTGSLVSFLSSVQSANNPLSAAKENLSRREAAMALRKELGVLAPEEELREREFAARVHALLDGAENLAPLQAAVEDGTAQTDAAEHALEKRIQNAMDFVHATFGAGQELLIFLTRLKHLPGADAFLKKNERYHTLCAEVLPDELEKTL